jgi:hypothetical protein
MLRLVAGRIRAAETRALMLEDFRYPRVDYRAIQKAQQLCASRPDSLGAEQLLRRAEAEILEQQLADNRRIPARLTAMRSAAERLGLLYSQLLLSAAHSTTLPSQYKKCRKKYRKSTAF